jgi:signal peptidase II
VKLSFGALKSPALLLPLVLILVADLWTKAWAWAYVPANADPRFPPQHPRVEVIEDFFYWANELNTGTLWGLGREYTSVLIILRFVILGFLFYLTLRTLRGQLWRRMGLGMVMAGALGNLYDNLTRADRGVRDFIDVKIPIPWAEAPHDLYDYPVFNIADSSVMVGALILFFAYGGLRATPHEEHAKHEEQVKQQNPARHEEAEKQEE